MGGVSSDVVWCMRDDYCLEEEMEVTGQLLHLEVMILGFCAKV